MKLTVYAEAGIPAYWVVDLDDLEDDESVATPEARAKWLNWFFSVVLPAAEPDAELLAHHQALR